MSDQARDDLVAAMEAVAKYDRTMKPIPDGEFAQNTAVHLLRKHGPALLALLDAEPVAWRIDGVAPDYPIFTTNKERANLPRQRGVTVTALYTRRRPAMNDAVGQ